jgi:pimeloyl-ACP methyl ester carboxylesterase
MTRFFSARDGLRLAAQEWPGDAHRVPLLCLPGITRSAADFAPLAARLRGQRRVIALDHVGHGASEKAPSLARYRIEESLRDVLDTMAALHCGRAIILGTSYGGILAMVLGVLRPSAIAGVVLNDIGPAIEPVGLGHVENFVGRDPALPSLEACVAHLQVTMPPLTLDEAGWAQFAAGTYAPDAQGVWRPRWDTRIAEVMRGGPPMPDLWPAFAALGHAPMLLLRGALSELLSEGTAFRMRRLRPEMGFVSVAETGHCPTLEEPEARAALEAFLAAQP